MLFIGRARELQQLKDFLEKDFAAIAVVYGRRRTGKTYLIEYATKGKNVIKFEGTQGQDRKYQLNDFINTIRKNFDNPLLEGFKPNTWKEAFETLAKLTSTGSWILYLEELQWMAGYKPDLISEFKPVWDNNFRKNPQLKIILCGSAPSFFLTHVIKSQALYNRTAVELLIEPFSIFESKKFLENLSIRSLFDAYLTLGGIPVYLEKLKDLSSPYLSLVEHSFKKNSFFLLEFEKIFISSFAHNSDYKKIIEFIGNNGQVSRKQILAHLAAPSSGTITDMLADLEACGFIRKITPYNKARNSLVALYQIHDAYLYFYFKFIKPQMYNIMRGAYQKDPSKALNLKNYQIWLGFAFERFCRDRADTIADVLKFYGVAYEAGSFFNRKSLANGKGVQIDLVFNRKDKVLTICEIKYQDKPVGLEVIQDFENKIESLGDTSKHTIQRVLVSASGVSKELTERAYFDKVLCFEDLLVEN